MHSSGHPSGRPVVLVAEDDQAVRQLPAQVLQEDVGARVVAVADGWPRSPS